MTNPDPNIERRLILALVLSALVFLLFLPFMERHQPPPAPAKKAAAKTAAAPAPPATTTTPAASARAAGQRPPLPAQAVAAHRARTVHLLTPVFAVTLSNQGAVARSWVLRKYTDNHGHPLNVVNEKVSAEHGYPLSFWTPDAGLNATLDKALFTMAETHPKAGETVVHFAWSNGHLAAEKQLTFQQGYVVDVTARLTRNGAPVPGAAIAWPGDFGDLSVSNHYSQLKLFEAPAGGKLATTSSSKVSNGGSTQQDFAFAGLQDLYFAAAFLPAHAGQQTVTTFNTVFHPAGGKAEHVAGIAFRTGAVNQFQLFVGPKEISLLNSINPRLGELVDFGIFSILAHPIFLWMKWTYVHWIHNYGWVIIFITFVITMAMFPFRWKAQKTSIKMAALAPKIKALNDKMKKFPLRDPRRQGVQQEIMKVYQDNGVNPLGGCLPMLVPVILIWAFYEVLEVAIALRHAPWIGYIHDLSAMDPYYILPIILVISQFWTMNLMPMTPGADPKQMKLMKWAMPLGLGYIFFFLPSGVNVYYLCSNLVSVGQQLIINKHFGYSPGKPKGKDGAGRLDASGKPAKPRLAPANMGKLRH